MPIRVIKVFKAKLKNTVVSEREAEMWEEIQGCEFPAPVWSFIGTWVQEVHYIIMLFNFQV